MSKEKKKDKAEDAKKSKAKKGSKTTALPVVEVLTEKPPTAEVTPAAVVEKAKPKAKAAAPKAAKPKAPAKKKAAPAAPEPEIEISTEEIGLRAYFISERRRTHGLPGDEHSDWIDAERELRFEAIEKKAIK